MTCRSFLSRLTVIRTGTARARPAIPESPSV
jgi:hypothetical protein